jgi:hypothetical protein
MKKFLAIIAIAVLFTAVAGAQDYRNGIGFRGGLYNGLTFKHFLGDKSAVELLGSTRWGGFEITALYEIHNRAFDVDRLNWYYGAGAHVGFWGSSYSGGSGTFIGVDGILGLEYNFSELPINISLDWKPAFNFINDSRFLGDGGALSVRYIW